MPKNWDYAELSKLAKQTGGAEKCIEIIEKSSRSAGKVEMMPVLGVAIAGAVALTAVTMKAIEYFKAKRKQSQAELEQAKQELIDGINQYNAEHENDTKSGLEAPDDETETDSQEDDEED